MNIVTTIEIEEEKLRRHISLLENENATLTVLVDKSSKLIAELVNDNMPWDTALLRRAHEHFREINAWRNGK